LVDAFIKSYNKKLGKSVETISQKAMNALISYSWPGNVRELQNVIEKAVIIANDKKLRIEIPENPKSISSAEPFKTLEDMEREYILKVLKFMKWRIDGPEGAAIVLGLNPSTLRFRMNKLGIKRPV
jgi:DNA-binding NtrC family response regulator